MKKFMVLFTVLLILASVATVYAQPKLDFRFSGFIDAQSLWYVNATPGGTSGPAVIYNNLPTDYKFGGPPGYVKGGALDKTVAYMESRARLKFDAIMDKNLSGTIFFEMDSSRWGDTSGANNRNQYGYWSGDRAAVEIKNVFIDFGLPYFGIPVPITMRVGLQPLSIRPNLLVYTDGMGITAGLKIDPLMIQPMWFKALEGKDARSDDVDVYGLHANAKIETFTLGGYGLYYDMKSYPFFGDPPPAYGLPATTNFAKMWWLGAYADGKLGPVNLNLDFIYDTGKVESRTTGIKDVDYDGWALYGKIDYPWDLFNFGLVAMYATGADTRETSATGLPGSATSSGAATSKVKSYVVPPGSEAGTNFGESVVFYNTWITRGDSGIASNNNTTAMGRGPIGGTWMAKAYGSFKATPWYKITLQGMYIGDTTENGNTFGTAITSSGLLRDDNSIGWELDLINEFNIYKNLKFTVGAGYLWADDALDLRSGPASNHSPKNPWNICTNLTFNF
jgi:hypothetical protein